MPDPLTDEERATLRPLHHEGTGYLIAKCACCEEVWPCKVSRLLAERGTDHGQPQFLLDQERALMRRQHADEDRSHPGRCARCYQTRPCRTIQELDWIDALISERDAANLIAADLRAERGTDTLADERNEARRLLADSDHQLEATLKIVDTYEAKLADLRNVLSEVAQYQVPGDPCPPMDQPHTAWTMRTISRAVRAEREKRGTDTGLRRRIELWGADRLLPGTPWIGREQLWTELLALLYGKVGERGTGEPETPCEGIGSADVEAFLTLRLVASKMHCPRCSGKGGA